jgi:hypothetical protein
MFLSLSMFLSPLILSLCLIETTVETTSSISNP